MSLFTKKVEYPFKAPGLLLVSCLSVGLHILAQLYQYDCKKIIVIIINSSISITITTTTKKYILNKIRNMTITRNKNNIIIQPHSRKVGKLCKMCKIKNLIC